MNDFRRLTRVGAATVACSVVIACGQAEDSTGGGSAVQITAHDYRFDPAELTASPGQAMRVELANKGERPHSIEFHLEGEAEAELSSQLPPGETRLLTFTAPGKPGKYVYYCPVGDHRSRGMEGTLVVRAP